MMATVTAERAGTGATHHRLDDPAFQAFLVLRIGFTVAPLLGLADLEGLRR